MVKTILRPTHRALARPASRAPIRPSCLSSCRHACCSSAPTRALSTRQSREPSPVQISPSTAKVGIPGWVVQPQGSARVCVAALFARAGILAAAPQAPDRCKAAASPSSALACGPKWHGLGVHNISVVMLSRDNFRESILQTQKR